MCILDADGRPREINPAFERLLGYELQDVCDRTLVALAHPADQADNQAALAELLTADVDQTATNIFTSRYLTRSGDSRWLEWSVSVVMEGVVRSLYCVARDRTHRHRKNSTKADGIPADEGKDGGQVPRLEAQSEAQVIERNEKLSTQLATVQAQYVKLLATEKQSNSNIRAAKAEALMYADVVKNMQVGIYIWQLAETDPGDGSTLCLLATNPAASAFTGVEATNMLGQLILEVFPQLAETDIPHVYAQVARNGEPCNLGEVPYEDGRVQKGIFSVKAFPLPNRCVGVAFENITERKRYEEIHREQEEQLRILFDQAAVGMARLSPDGHWIQVNQCLCDMLGYAEDALLQKTFQSVTHPEDQPVDRETYRQLVNGAVPQKTFEKRYLTQDGEVVWAYVTVSVVRGHTLNTGEALTENVPGELLYFIATIQDITERKRANLALTQQTDDLMTVNLMLTEAMSMLEQRNQELDQFAYVTSHDLKAPLRAIVNLASWIEEDIGDTFPAENKEQFELLKSRVHRMEGLINGLLEYSRVGRSQHSLEPVDIAEILAEIVDSLSPLGEFTVEIGPSMPVLKSKRVLLLQVFSNLINNAIKHHDREDGIVRVSACESGDFYEFAIADDGPGIDPIYHEKIFTIFQTLRARDDLESTGIGLSLVKKIVTAEGGSITLESAVDQGATFRFTWPKKSPLGLNVQQCFSSASMHPAFVLERSVTL